ncbi:hypothetical protein [Prescottella equi]|uniref:hypothetical protein n=1 Tax=Rhodococcus hoagii TaxID=43767 RepID=UPI00111C3C1D|nr:hypothetical protein [Prescottella equi]
MQETCPHGHQIRSSADRDADGFCKACRRAANARYKAKQRAAIGLVQALRARGVGITDALQLSPEPMTRSDEAIAQAIVDAFGGID